MRLFEYIYFRIAKFKFKKDGMDAPTALFFVSLMQSQWLIVILFGILRIFFSREDIREYKKNIPIVGIAIVMATVVLGLNYITYKGKYWIFSERWRDTEGTLKKTINGLLVILALVSPLIAWVSLAFLLRK